MARQKAVNDRHHGLSKDSAAYHAEMNKAKAADAGSYTRLGGSSGTIWHTEPDPYIECCSKVLCCGCCGESHEPTSEEIWAQENNSSWCVIM
jgi:hypothetical protein